MRETENERGIKSRGGMRDRELCQIESARDVVLSANYDWVFTVNKNNCGFHLRRICDEHAFVSSFCYTALCACCCSRGVAGACQEGPSSKHKIKLFLWSVSLVCIFSKSGSFVACLAKDRSDERGQVRDTKEHATRLMLYIRSFNALHSISFASPQRQPKLPSA